MESLETYNRFLDNASPMGIVRWALELAERPILFTNFRPSAIATLHLVAEQQADIPVVWVDTGYNTIATYHYAEQVSETLGLNLKIYTPLMSVKRREAIHGAIPKLGTAAHQAFTQEVKLEPFNRALRELQPDVWFTGIRREQTAFRGSLNAVSLGPRKTLRIAPFFHHTENNVDEYIVKHHLPNYQDYLDVTKGPEHRECGLQLLA